MKTKILPKLGINQSRQNSAAGGGVRVVAPESLDGLPPDSPEARASRRDLRVLNGLLGTNAWFGGVMRERVRAGEAVLEIGAGTGELARHLRPVAPGLAGLDLLARPGDWPATAPWFQTDVLSFADWDRFPVVIGNLFFHHFDPAQLAGLGAQLGGARMIIANEPLRTTLTARLFSLVSPLMGAHPVTRHDGRISIAAGFRHDELARLLQLDPEVWHWRAEETWLGANRLVAERRS
ncbi:MAG: hypothetical protein Q8J74_13735 [Candidatus Didemnitutus sp.]|nr:hypothetical protein [Candidatus Didemnitutus sp.]